jgi:hypothetical protein
MVSTTAAQKDSPSRSSTLTNTSGVSDASDGLTPPSATQDSAAFGTLKRGRSDDDGHGLPTPADDLNRGDALDVWGYMPDHVQMHNADRAKSPPTNDAARLAQYDLTDAAADVFPARKVTGRGNLNLFNENLLIFSQISSCATFSTKSTFGTTLFTHGSSPTNTLSGGRRGRLDRSHRVNRRRLSTTGYPPSLLSCYLGHVRIRCTS